LTSGLPADTAASIGRMTETEVQIRRPAAGAPISAPSERGDRRVVVIKPPARFPRLDLPELWHYRELWATLVWRDVKVRYKQTFIGVAWAILVPLFTLVVYVIVYGKFAHFGSGNLKYPVLVIGGLLPMQYFTSSLTGSGGSIVAGNALVSKVYFPRVLLPIAAVTVPAVDFVMSFSVMLGVMAWYHAWPVSAVAVLAPLFLLLALVTALGIGLFLAAVNVRYRDVQYAVPVFLQVLPLLSGVPYAIGTLPHKWQWFLAFNPMSTVISGWRWTMLGGGAPDPRHAAVGVAVAAICFATGLSYFRAFEPQFADRI
jgi:lipopolysaccharide transport system permease protein